MYCTVKAVTSAVRHRTRHSEGKRSGKATHSEVFMYVSTVLCKDVRELTMQR